MPEVIHKESHKHAPNSLEVITKRRELVARLRVRGLTMREIVNALAAPGDSQFINPQSDQPFTLDTIKHDCHALDKQWRERAGVTIAEHKARHYIELQEVKRAGWKALDLASVLRALKQEADLLGLDAPKQLDINIIRKRAQEIADRLGVPVNDVLAQADRIAGEAWAGIEA